MSSSRPPLIGITTYARDAKNEFHLPAEYSEAVHRAGGIPYLIPPLPLDVTHLIERCDGLLLAGGGDMDSSHYGGHAHPSIYHVDADRDALELALARHVVRHDVPTLAICRGAQVLNVALGGTLVEHLPDEVGESVSHRLPPREPTPHDVTVSAESRLAGILGCLECTAMSWHHQAIRRVADGLHPVAQAPDGTIEAVESRSHLWLIAVQWHPELTAAKDEVQQSLFESFVDAARPVGSMTV